MINPELAEDDEELMDLRAATRGLMNRSVRTAGVRRVIAELAGFDWDNGNRAKCQKHGVCLEVV